MTLADWSGPFGAWCQFLPPRADTALRRRGNVALRPEEAKLSENTSNHCMSDADLPSEERWRYFAEATEAASIDGHEPTAEESVHVEQQGAEEQEEASDRFDIGDTDIGRHTEGGDSQRVDESLLPQGRRLRHSSVAKMEILNEEEAAEIEKIGDGPYAVETLGMIKRTEPLVVPGIEKRNSSAAVAPNALTASTFMSQEFRSASTTTPTSSPSRTPWQVSALSQPWMPVVATKLSLLQWKRNAMKAAFLRETEAFPAHADCVLIALGKATPTTEPHADGMESDAKPNVVQQRGTGCNAAQGTQVSLVPSSYLDMDRLVSPTSCCDAEGTEWLLDAESTVENPDPRVVDPSSPRSGYMLPSCETSRSARVLRRASSASAGFRLHAETEPQTSACCFLVHTHILAKHCAIFRWRRLLLGRCVQMCNPAVTSARLVAFADWLHCAVSEKSTADFKNSQTSLDQTHLPGMVDASELKARMRKRQWQRSWLATDEADQQSQVLRTPILIGELGRFAVAPARRTGLPLPRLNVDKIEDTLRWAYKLKSADESIGRDADLVTVLRFFLRFGIRRGLALKRLMESLRASPDLVSLELCRHYDLRSTTGRTEPLGKLDNHRLPNSIAAKNQSKLAAHAYRQPPREHPPGHMTLEQFLIKELSAFEARELRRFRGYCSQAERLQSDLGQTMVLQESTEEDPYLSREMRQLILDERIRKLEHLVQLPARSLQTNVGRHFISPTLASKASVPKHILRHPLLATDARGKAH
eukprot:TRINITY_DN18512_c1_g1_i1.p1 TRINITY_DN18512_c1_g1~~TRINITY_DN18512_c1_g1_i1.p1  ORF type:complete len:778 (+),score=117.44 TRINITY_DN18512_c1_g1_i1:59-2335(+)